MVWAPELIPHIPDSPQSHSLLKCHYEMLGTRRLHQCHLKMIIEVYSSGFLLIAWSNLSFSEWMLIISEYFRVDSRIFQVLYPTFHLVSWTNLWACQPIVIPLIVLIVDENLRWKVDKMESIMVLRTLNDSNNSATLNGIYINRSGGYQHLSNISSFHSDEQM